MTITNVTLILLAVLAVVLLAGAIVSYREYKGRQQPTSDAYTLLKAHLDLCANAAEAQKEMLRTFCDAEAKQNSKV